MGARASSQPGLGLFVAQGDDGVNSDSATSRDSRGDEGHHAHDQDNKEYGPTIDRLQAEEKRLQIVAER